MKTVSLLSVVMMAVCLIGCENSELINCQQEKQTLQAQTDTLQQQLDQANATITEKDGKIEAIEAQCNKDKKQLMQNFTTMMEKQVASEKNTGEKLAGKDKQITELQKTVESLKQENKKLNDVIKDMTKPVEEQM